MEEDNVEVLELKVMLESARSLLGFVLLSTGEVFVSAAQLQDGLPADHGIDVQMDEERGGVVVSVKHKDEVAKTS